MSEPEAEYRCFIGNLSWSTSDRGLKQAFEKYGRLVDAKVVMDRNSGRSRGFGFVSFEDEKDMEEAIEAMNGMDLDGRSITVDKAKPNQDGDRDRDRDRDRGHDRDRGGGGGRYRDGDGGGGRGGSGDGCFKCGKPGHFARECPSSGGGGGGRYGGGGGGREDRGGGRYGSDRDGERYGGGGRQSRDYGGSRGGSGNDRYKRDRSGPYERPSSGGGR